MEATQATISKGMKELNVVYVYTMGYYSALKRKEMLTYARAWINLEDTALGKTNQSQRTNRIKFLLNVKYLGQLDS